MAFIPAWTTNKARTRIYNIEFDHTLERTGEGWKRSGMTLVVTHARGNEMARDYPPKQ
jgi:hypothetical protein